MRRKFFDAKKSYFERERHTNYGLGDRIRESRLRAGLTQVQLAEMIGMSHKHLSNVERGIYEVRTDGIRRISEALGVSSDYLLFDDRRHSRLEEAMMKAHFLPKEAQAEAADVIEAFLAIKKSKGQIPNEPNIV